MPSDQEIRERASAAAQATYIGVLKKHFPNPHTERTTFAAGVLATLGAQEARLAFTLAETLRSDSSAP